MKPGKATRSKIPVYLMASWAKWLSFRLRTKWLWARVPFLSSKRKPVNFQKTTVKARSIATFLLTNLRSRYEAAHRQILSNCHYAERGALTRKGLSNLV